MNVRRHINEEGELRQPLGGGSGRPISAPETQQPGPGHEIWWETEYGRWRLGLEAAAMERFPGFRLARRQGQLHWVGPLLTQLRHEGRVRERRFVVRLSYAAHFPLVAPTIVIESPRLPTLTPHLIRPRQPCLYYPGDGSSHGYDHARTTAATLISWTGTWLHAFEVWRFTHVWPGSEL